MDETLRQLLDQLPVRAPRSKLEPHTEVIRVLRQKRRTYAEIAAFLREHLQLSVAPSTIHDFVKTRARQARRTKTQPLELPPAGAAPWEPPAGRSPVIDSPLPAPAPAPATDEGRERMRALRAQPPPAPAPAKPSRFAFDPTEPLTLQPPLQPPPKEK